MLLAGTGRVDEVIIALAARSSGLIEIWILILGDAAAVSKGEVQNEGDANITHASLGSAAERAAQGGPEQFPAATVAVTFATRDPFTDPNP